MHWCSKMTCFVNSINSELLQKEYQWYKILLHTSNECISQKVISFWFIWNKEATRKPGHGRLPVCSSTLVKQSDVRKLRKLKYHSLAGRGTLEQLIRLSWEVFKGQLSKRLELRLLRPACAKNRTDLVKPMCTEYQVQNSWIRTPPSVPNKDKEIVKTKLFKLKSWRVEESKARWKWSELLHFPIQLIPASFPDREPYTPGPVSSVQQQNLWMHHQLTTSFT